MRSRLRSEYLALIVLVLLSTVLAGLTLPQYGESWDEFNFFGYGREALQAYTHLGDPAFMLEFTDPTLRYYGPWFLMLIVMVSKVFPQLIISDIAHFMTFLVFQAGVVFFYLLARRWFKPWAAFGATLLFSTQPLLWGHAFINARDIPLMTGFIATIYFGLRWVDGIKKDDLFPERAMPDPGRALLKEDGKRIPVYLRLLLPLLLVAGAAALWLWTRSLTAAWQSAAPLKADLSSARALDLYLRPILAQFWGLALFAITSLAWGALLFLPFMPNTRRHLWRVELQPLFVLLGRWLRRWDLLLASFFLGLTIATRVLGAAAGVLVLILLFAKHRRRAAFPALMYVLLSLPVVVLTWPYLWGEPFLRLILTLRVMLKFPWPGTVLFDGALFAANVLPRTYLPRLMLYQLTEPALLLILLSLAICLIWVFKKAPRRDLAALTAMWFGLPLAAAVAGRPYLYDNFRHFLFTLPALFLLTGAGIEWLFEKWKSPAWRSAVLFLLVLPGLIGGVALHPYEYVYYNSLVGGVQGAQGRYELDYWGTSMRVMAEYANDHLPDGAQVVVWGPPTSFWRYARADMQVYDARDSARPQSGYYAVILCRAAQEQTVLADLPALHTVSVRGVRLAILKYVQP